MMSVISRFQFNAIMRSGAIAVVLGFGTFPNVGGNISDSTSSSFGFYNNALFDGRGFGPQGALTGYTQAGSGTVSFSATSGSGVTMTATTASRVGITTALSGTSIDVGLIVTLNGGATIATVTASTLAGGLPTCTVNITGTVLPSTGPFTFMVALPLDANGWPTTQSECVVSVGTANVLDGQLGVGVYYGQVKSLTANPAAPSLNGGAFTSNGGTSTPNAVVMDQIVNSDSGGIRTTTYRLTVTGVGAQIILWFSQAIPGGAILLRDGTQNFGSFTEFNPLAIAYCAQFASLRLMGYCNAIYATDTTWASRVPNTANVANHFGSGGTARQRSWEVTIRLMNAIHAYPFSKMNTAWLNVGGFVVPDYGTQLSALLNDPTLGISSAITVNVEKANEPWNSAYQFSFSYFQSGNAEAQVIANYAITPTTLCQMVSDGTTVTATVLGLPDGTTPTNNFTLTPGSTYSAIVVNNNTTARPDQFATDAWAQGKPSTPITITIVNSTTLTWPAAGKTTAGTWANQGVASVTGNQMTVASMVYGTFANNQYVVMAGLPAGTKISASAAGGGAGVYTLSKSAASPISVGTPVYATSGAGALIFNPTSDMVADGASYSLYDFSAKFYTREVYRLQQAWKLNRPQDRFLLNMQQYSGIPVHYLHGDYLAVKYNGQAAYAGLKSWLWATAIAPYMATTSGTNSRMTGVPATDMTTVFNEIYSNLPADTYPSSLLTTNTGSMRNHVYAAQKYQVAAILYEAGVDTQSMSYTYGGTSFGYQTMIAGHARNADCMRAFLGIWNNLGGQDVHLVQCTPGTWTNTQQGNWAICQSLTDTTSPKLVGYLGYDGTARSYNDTINDAGGLTVNFSVVKTYNMGGAANTNVTPNAYYFLKNTLLLQQVDTLIEAPAAKYAITVYGSDTQATVLTLQIDSTTIGTVTLPVNGLGYGGSANYTAATPTTGPTQVVGGVTKLIWTPATPGPHSVSLVLPANTGNAPGVQTIRFDAIA